MNKNKTPFFVNIILRPHWLINCFILLRYLRRSFAAQAFITCSRKGDWREANKADLNGLVQGHAYTITGIPFEVLEHYKHCHFRLNLFMK